jgi:hypothetical protein
VTDDLRIVVLARGFICDFKVFFGLGLGKGWEGESWCVDCVSGTSPTRYESSAGSVPVGRVEAGLELELDFVAGRGGTGAEGSKSMATGEGLRRRRTGGGEREAERDRESEREAERERECERERERVC